MTPVSIELLRARALQISRRFQPADPEERAAHIARIRALDRVNLQSYVEHATMTPREIARLSMTDAEREADEKLEADEITAGLQEDEDD